MIHTHKETVIRIFQIIKSCKTRDHIDAARRLVNNYHRQFNKPIPNSMMERLAAKERQIITS